jgi:hypothetical protein
MGEVLKKKEGKEKGEEENVENDKRIFSDWSERGKYRNKEEISRIRVIDRWEIKWCKGCEGEC